MARRSTRPVAPPHPTIPLSGPASPAHGASPADAARTLPPAATSPSHGACPGGVARSPAPAAASPARPAALPATPAPRAAALALLAALPLAVAGCRTTTHPAGPTPLGTVRDVAALLAVIDQPGPVELETVVSADWAVPLEGLVNVDHPAARAAGLRGDRLEPIQVYFHALRHPTRGLFLVDSGVERALRDRPAEAAFRGLVASQMHLEAMKIHVPLGDWLAAHPGPVQGVLLTHLHPDHVAGLPDVAPGTPVYAGPGEAAARALVNLVLQANTDRALARVGPLHEWPFPGASGSRAVVDVLGDGTIWALSVPGHTRGSTAYLIRTPRGPVLLAGDACHTRWGWDHGVEPGSFSEDRPESARSLAWLRELASAHPGLDVRLGHQR